MIRFSDWMLLLIGGLFTLIGLAMIGSDKDPGTGLIVTVFFGICTTVAFWNLLKKQRFKTRISKEVNVDLAGNIEIPVSTRLILLLGIGLLLLGIVITMAGEIPWHIYSIGVFLAFVGAFLLIAHFSGYLYRALMVNIEGLWIIEPWGRYCIAWDNIESINVSEWNSNHFVVINVHDPMALIDSLQTVRGKLPQRTKKLGKHMGWNMGLMGGHVAINPGTFGLDTAWFFQALESYVKNPQKRTQLQVKKISDSRW